MIPVSIIEGFPVGGNTDIVGVGVTTVGRSVGVGVSVARGMGVAVIVRVGVSVGVRVGDGVIVSVGVAVNVGVGVGVDVSVADGVARSLTCVPDAKTVNDCVTVCKIPAAFFAAIVMVCVPGASGVVGRYVQLPPASVVTVICCKAE